MNTNYIKKEIANIVNHNCKETVTDYDSNFFDLGMDSYDLLDFAFEIASCFNVSINEVFKNTNYTFLTVNNIAEKITGLKKNRE